MKLHKKITWPLVSYSHSPAKSRDACQTQMSCSWDSSFVKAKLGSKYSEEFAPEGWETAVLSSDAVYSGQEKGGDAVGCRISFLGMC